jgi:ribulose-5-phosphate 4-epimerase/fuculose-1-phosphate aldolase
MAEGERLAALLQDKQVMFLKNHGVIAVGDTIAQAYRRLYKLEKACQTQLLAMSSGQPLEVMSEAVIAEVLQRAPEDRHPIRERERLYFEAMMRVVDRVNPGYAD